jgi:serine/threonine-protein kinase RIO1
VVVEHGQVVTIDVPRLVERHNRAARRLLQSDR